MIRPIAMSAAHVCHAACRLQRALDGCKRSAAQGAIRLPSDVPALSIVAAAEHCSRRPAAAFLRCCSLELRGRSCVALTRLRRRWRKLFRARYSASGLVLLAVGLQRRQGMAAACMLNVCSKRPPALLCILCGYQERPFRIIPGVPMLKFVIQKPLLQLVTCAAFWLNPACRSGTRFWRCESRLAAVRSQLYSHVELRVGSEF